MAVEPRYDFDAYTQRELLDDPAEAQSWVAALSEQGISGDPMRVVWLRILGRLDEAAVLGWQVLARAGGPATASEAPTTTLPLSCVTAAIRLAHVLQWQKRFDVAHVLFERARHKVENVQSSEADTAYAGYLKPFVYQHWARCYFDQHNFDHALLLSKKALGLRLKAGVPQDQVSSSTSLVEGASARIADGETELVD